MRRLGLVITDNIKMISREEGAVYLERALWATYQRGRRSKASRQTDWQKVKLAILRKLLQKLEELNAKRKA